MEKYKKLSTSGSINIPVAMRRDLGLEPHDPIILSTSEGGIIMKPYVPRCMYCGRQDQVHMVFRRYVCAGCARRVCDALEKMGNGGEDNG